MHTRYAVWDWRTQKIAAIYLDRGHAQRFVQSQIDTDAKNGVHLFIEPLTVADSLPDKAGNP